MLKSCLSLPLTDSLTAKFCGSPTSSAVTKNGPSGADVCGDFVGKKLSMGGAPSPRDDTSMKLRYPKHVPLPSPPALTRDARLPITMPSSASCSKIAAGSLDSTTVSPSLITALGDLRKALMGAGASPRSVLHVVYRHADQLARLRRRGSESNVGERRSIGRRGGAFQRGPVLVESLYQPVDKVMRPQVRDVRHRRRYIYDAIVPLRRRVCNHRRTRVS